MKYNIRIEISRREKQRMGCWECLYNFNVQIVMSLNYFKTIPPHYTYPNLCRFSWKLELTLVIHQKNAETMKLNAVPEIVSVMNYAKLNKNFHNIRSLNEAKRYTALSQWRSIIHPCTGYYPSIIIGRDSLWRYVTATEVHFIIVCNLLGTLNYKIVPEDHMTLISDRRQ